MSFQRVVPPSAIALLLLMSAAVRAEMTVRLTPETASLFIYEPFTVRLDVESDARPETPELPAVPGLADAGAAPSQPRPYLAYMVAAGGPRGETVRITVGGHAVCVDFRQPVGEPVTWYCIPSDDVLPHPGACLVTGQRTCRIFMLVYHQHRKGQALQYLYAPE